MDTLRAALEILFNEMKIEPLLRNKAEGIDELFERDWFRRAYQLKFSSYSLDQCDLTASMVSSYFFCAVPGCKDSAFSPGRCVFNALVHFSSKILIDKGEPICKFEHILRWDSLVSILGEDLFTTSYLASRDVISKRARSSFDWKLVIEQSDSLVNKVLSKEMADVHMHLNGSSGNFDLNWLSLMNKPHGREKQFRVLDAFLHPSHVIKITADQGTSLHALSLKASAIRFYLYVKYVQRRPFCPKENSLIRGLIDANEKQAILLSNDWESILISNRSHSNPHGRFVDHDYACQIDDEAIKNNPNCIISGERRILYHCFKECYSGALPIRDRAWLYAYILIKNRIRTELIQTNGFVGFGNFDLYEKRKELFIKGLSVYERLVEPWAIGQYCLGLGDRYIEPRITPKKNAADLNDTLKNIDKKLLRLSSAKLDCIHYVLHFIKKRDNAKDDGLVLNPRHYQLREEVFKQSSAVNDFRKAFTSHQRVVGIDAANSEVFARPEVFAQAFRYLHKTKVIRVDGEKVFPLGMTYHVGEDFLSLIDGLRAIDEVLHFLRFGENNRLGHALVLGIDPESYLKLRHNTLLLPKQMVLDNIAWCLHEMLSGPSLCSSVISDLENAFTLIFEEVYQTMSGVKFSDYYESWLLRGDNPVRYNSYISNHRIDTATGVSEWSRFDLNDDQDAVIARQKPLACELYYRYHFDQNVRKKGGEIMEFICPDGMAEVIHHLQIKMLNKLGVANIGIETNPTSNRRIGGFSLYRDLPVFKFVPFSIKGREVSASVNTDDRGVFTTSLDREYALLAGALYKNENGSDPQRYPMVMSRICDWLECIRNNGWNQRFLNSANK